MDCLSCGHGNPQDATFCGECAQSLAPAIECPSCRRRNPAGQKFCHGCASPLRASAPLAPRQREPHSYTPKHLADKILRSRSAVEGERKRVTVLFADVKESTELAEELDPEEWHAILDRFFQILADGVHRFEGTVNQYTGDGIMALFGAPIAHEDHAQRACYAALHLQERLRGYADELRLRRSLSFSVRMGINSGEVVVGKIGDDLRMDYTAQGPAVNLAARMEHLAEPGSAYLTDRTAKLVSGYFKLRDLGPTKVKGVQDAVHVHELQSVGEFRSRFDVSRARGLSRFVGRDREMALLDAALDRAQKGRAQIIGIVAEPGTGKSRLSYEFGERCRARGIQVISASCPPYGKAVPLGFHMAFTRSYFEIRDQDSDEAARNKIAGRMSRLDPALAADIPFMLDFLGVAEPGRSLPTVDAEARQREFLRISKHLVDTRGGAVRVGLCEDMQWIDASSQAVALELHRVEANTPTLTVLNFRPEHRPPEADRPNYEEIRLKPLTAESSAELLRDLLGPAAAAPELEALIQGRAAGNPFFVEEIVQSLVESGHLQGSRAAYELAKPVDRIEVPESARAVLAARIDRLDEQAREVLHRASVIGDAFPVPLLEDVCGAPPGQLDGVLHELAAADFIYQEAAYPEVEFAFKHPLTQEVAFGSQLRESRQRVHGEVARCLAERHADKLGEKAALIAHHQEAAAEPLAAADWHRRAAEWMGLRDVPAACRHWSQVRSLLRDRDSPEAAELRLAACTQLLRLARFVGIAAEDEASIYAEGRELAQLRNDVGAAAAVTCFYAQTRMMSGDLDAFLERSREAVRLAAQTDDLGLQLGTRVYLVISQGFGGRLSEAVSLADEGEKLSRGNAQLGVEFSGYSPAVWFVMMRGRLEAYMGRLAEAQDDLERAAQLARHHGESEILTWALVGHAAFAECSGVVEGDLHTAREALQMAEKTGSVNARVYARLALGLAHSLAGEWSAGVSELEEALEAARGAAVHEAPHILAALAEAYVALGDLERARTAATRAVEQAERSNRMYQARTLIALARVLMGADEIDDPSEIERVLDQAAAAIEDTGTKSFEPVVHEERARLARLQSDDARCERELSEAHRLYVQIGARGHAERIAQAQ